MFRHHGMHMIEGVPGEPTPGGGNVEQPPAPATPAATPAQEPPKPEAKAGDEDPTDWKAMARKHEQRAKENAAAAKELADLKAAQMNDQQKAEAAAQQASERAEAAERRAALAEAAVEHGLSKDDLELLDGVPADQIDDRAKKLAARIKAAGPPQSSGSEVGGGKGGTKPETLTGALAAHLSK